MNISGYTDDVSMRDIDVRLDTLDLSILSEMELDGRKSISDLARKLGISRTTLWRKIKMYGLEKKQQVG